MNPVEATNGGSPNLSPDPSWTLDEVASLSEGQLRPGVRGNEAGRDRVRYREISLDTRSLSPGDFYVALRGENHDGHAFLDAAVSGEARGALVDHPVEAPELPQIIVDDSLRGWQRWSANHRRAWSGRPLVGITGSSGKTTAKDVLAHLLRGLGPVWSTEGNRNNHVGVPWSLLGLEAAHQFAVIEMGMNHPGEISQLSQLAAPTAAVITDVGRAHIGHLGSREQILEAKLEILDGLPDEAPLVLPDDPWIFDRLSPAVKERRLYTFGFGPNADWRPEGDVEYSLDGTRFATRQTGPISFSILGRGPLLSALAALATLEALGMDPKRVSSRLASAPRREMRMESRRIGGIHWLLDCYNASPESTHLAIEFLQTVPHPGRKVLVLGELGELGSEAESIHRELGRLAVDIDVVLFVGHGARTAHEACTKLPGAGQTYWMASRDEAADWLASGLREGDLVLLKAARRLELERILERLAPGPSLSSGEDV